MPFAVGSCLDVVVWFNDRALGDGEYLQPQKLHRLLYLAQAYFTVAYPRSKLMPAVFVTDDFGPIEPNVYQAFAYGRPHMLESNALSETASHFLDGLWRRFGNASAEQLTRKVAQHAPVMEAMAKGRGEEIPFDAMVAYCASEAAQRRGAPSVDKVIRPRMLRSQSGKAVAVTSWTPKGVAGR